MLVPRVFVKNLRLTQRLIDDFLTNAIGAMISARFVISTAYFGLNSKRQNMALIDTIDAKLQHPIFQTLADLIKKFKSSKSFYGIFYLLALFTIQQAIAWKYGTAISTAINDMGSEWYYGFVAAILEHGSIELVVLGVGLIGVLSYVEVNKDTTNKENDSNQTSSFDVQGDVNSIITIGNDNQINQNVGITDKALQQILANYQKTINLLEEKLSHSLPAEEKYKLSMQLESLQKELKIKTQEIATL